MSTETITEIIWAVGHANIQSAHPTTLMITKDTHLTHTGDCIVAVGADKAALDLSPQIKQALKRPNTKVTILLEAGGLTEQISALGSPNLVLTHPTDIVIRKSQFVSDRTLAVCADKASKDIQRELVSKLKNPKQKIKITLSVHQLL